MAKTFDTTIPSMGGGCIVKTISANPTVISSVECRDCYVTAAVGSSSNAEILLVALGSACASAAGFPVPTGVGAAGALSAAISTAINTPAPLYLAIQSLSALSFYAANVSNLDQVAILYRT